MIELFSKQPGGLAPLEGRDIVLIPPEEDASSLSAILMDPDYYGIVVRYRAVIDGLPLLAPADLIALKARAWLDLTNRRELGEPVKSVDIKKHRNDIFRLSFLLAGDSRLDVPRRVREDLYRFLDLHPSTAESWREVGMALTASGLSVDPAEVIALLRRAFNAD
jgi:hypothetical protein